MRQWLPTASFCFSSPTTFTSSLLRPLTTAAAVGSGGNAILVPSHHLWNSKRLLSSKTNALQMPAPGSSLPLSVTSPFLSSVADTEKKVPPRRPLTIGNTANGKMKEPIRVSWMDLVGEESAPPGSRLSGGQVLAMLDMCASKASQEAADFATNRSPQSPPQERYLTCTVGVTNTMFASPILHGDLVRLDGRVIHCGDSSVGIHITFYRRSFRSHKENVAGESFFTMVTITPDLKAAHIVPAMDLTDPDDIDTHYRYLAIREASKEASKAAARRRELKNLTFQEADCTINSHKHLHVRIADTKITANRIFFSSCLNNHNTVFGGELMSWMEKHAVHCGRCFTGNRHVYCIGMHSVAFPQPVFATDWVTLEACVIYVRNTTMEVDVTLRVERKNEGKVITNKASFVLINSNDIRMKTDIPVGILLDKNTSQEELQLFLEAKERYHRSIARSVNFKKLVQSKEVSN